MHLVKKILILVIIFIAFLIIYNLIKSRQTNKLTYAKEKEELKEGFGRKGVNIKSISKKNGGLPIREVFVKSSYNTAINKNNYATTDQIKLVLSRGCRFIDFEIYTRNNIEYVSYSEDPENKSMDTKNRLPLASAFSTTIGNAFNDPAPSPNDPLFISLRIKNNSAATYSRISKLIRHNFRGKLYRGKVNSETRLNDIKGKVIVIIDITSSPNYKILSNFTTDHRYKLFRYVDMETGSIQFPKYTYSNLDTLTQKPIMTNSKGTKTNLTSFNIITPPPKNDNLNAPNPNEIVSKLYPQFLPQKFYKESEELEKYEKIFNSNKTSFVPMATIVSKKNAKTNAA